MQYINLGKPFKNRNDGLPCGIRHRPIITNSFDKCQICKRSLFDTSFSSRQKIKACPLKLSRQIECVVLDSISKVSEFYLILGELDKFRII